MIDMKTNPNQLNKTKVAKDRIFHAVMRLMNDNEYDKLSVRNVCQSAGISIGTFYHYFTSRDDLLTYIIACGYDEYKKIDEDNKMSQPQRVIDILTYFAAYLSGFGLSFLSNFLSVKNQALNVNSILKLNTYNREVVKDLIGYIQQSQDDGMIESVYSVRKIYDELNAIFYGNVFNWCLSGGDYELMETVRKMLTAHFNLYLKAEYRI
ncbi:MAG TPA: TetR/AcrR family transcriptional regulator [Anaerovoracaceae bacterium]|nr:TetR/AcrR family transcriptional regulator [Anaerovoracaceae bacterium]